MRYEPTTASTQTGAGSFAGGIEWPGFALQRAAFLVSGQSPVSRVWGEQTPVSQSDENLVPAASSSRRSSR